MATRTQKKGGSESVPGKVDPPAASVGGADGPTVIDLGKKSRKQIKRLRKGSGKLMDAVQRSLQELQSTGTLSAASPPVVLVVREKRRRSRAWY